MAHILHLSSRAQRQRRHALGVTRAAVEGGALVDATRFDPAKFGKIAERTESER
jgi:hypothetical protein